MIKNAALFLFKGQALGLAACFVLILAGCSSAPEPEEPAPPKPQAIVGDDGQLVSKTAFLNEPEAWKPIGNVLAWKKEGAEVVFSLEEGLSARISFPSATIYRLRFDPSGKNTRDDSYAVIKRNLAFVEVAVEESPEAVLVSTGRLSLNVAKKSFLISVSLDGRIIARDTKPIQTAGSRIVAFRDIDPGDRFYGLGEKTGPLAKNGQYVKMWNSDTYRYKYETDPLYMSIPFFVNAGARGSWGLLFDNTYQSFLNLGQAEKDELFFGATGGEMNYYFIAGPNVAQVVRDYTELTGRMELPPKWALGYQQSRYSYETQEEVLSLARTFREKKIPADVIYLDIDFMDSYQSFTVHPENFADAAGMLKTLKAQGFKAITIIDPGIKAEKGYPVYDSGLAGDHFVKTAEGAFVRGTVWPGMCFFPDFTRPETRQWWGDQYRGLLDLGIDGIWNDMNEPSVFNTKHKTLPWEGRHWDFGLGSLHAKIHNVYGQQMARATFEGLSALRPQARPFVLSRAGYAGSQRYSAFWTGDNSSQWEHLKMNVSMALNLGLSGFPLVGADVGGYSETPSTELFVRWMQLGALMPLYRNHTEKNTPPQEPWAFGEEAEKLARKAITLRYELIPYLYDRLHEAAERGDPIVRPLFYDFPSDPKSYQIDDEFLIGEGLLAAPVLAPGAKSREVYFPIGGPWFDWFTGQEFLGGKSYTLETPLPRILLFARGGAIVPTQEAEQWIGERTSNPLRIRFYPGGNGTHRLFQDDGRSVGYKKGDFSEIRLDFSGAGPAMKIVLAAINKPTSFQPRDEYALFRLMQVKPPRHVAIDGKPITLYGDSGGVTESDKSSAWYEMDGSLLIKVFHPEKDQVLEIGF